MPSFFKPDLKIWLQTEANDETSDRNKNGIIDLIDDTVDSIKELQQQGFKRPEDIQYLELFNGIHDMATWAKLCLSFWCGRLGGKRGFVVKKGE